MADDEDETMSEGFSASEDEWKPPKNAPGGGESSDDDDSEFEEVPAAAVDKARKKEAKPRAGAKAVQGVVKKRKPANQSLRTKLYNKYRPPPKTLTSPGSGNNSPSASTSRMASKNATAPNEASEYRNDGSSSESSVDDYLVNPAELDLQSSFFQSGSQLAAGGRQPSKSPEPVFDCNAGIKNLSDSDSEDNNESSTEDQKTPAGNAFDFRGLLEKANSLERAKEAIAKREAERQRDKSVTGADDSLNAAAMDVNSLLALGENAHRSNNIIMDQNNIPQQRLQKTKSTRIKKRQNRTRPNSTLVLSQAAGDESDDSDLEEVADDSTAATTSTAHDTTHSDVATDLEIHVELPSRQRARDRKRQDLEMAIRRKINRDLKERQLLLHKASLLCCFARSFNYNRIANSTALWQKAVQLLPSKNSYPSEQGTEQRYFQAFVTWFKTAIKLPNPNLYADDMRPDPKRRKAKCQKAKIIRGLLQQFVNKEASCKQDMVLMFVALVRGMGMQCRLVVNMTPLPMKPSQADLLTVKMKPEPEKKAPSSKDEKPSTSGAAQRSNSVDGGKDVKAPAKSKPLKTSKSEDGGGDADVGKTSAQQKREHFATSKKSQQDSQEPPAKKPLQKKSSTEKAPAKEAPAAKGPAAKKPDAKKPPSKEPAPKEPPPKELPKRSRNLPKNVTKPEAGTKTSQESKVPLKAEEATEEEPKSKKKPALSKLKRSQSDESQTTEGASGAGTSSKASEEPTVSKKKPALSKLKRSQSDESKATEGASGPSKSSKANAAKPKEPAKKKSKKESDDEGVSNTVACARKTARPVLNKLKMIRVDSKASFEVMSPTAAEPPKITISKAAKENVQAPAANSNSMQPIVKIKKTVSNEDEEPKEDPLENEAEVATTTSKLVAKNKRSQSASSGTSTTTLTDRMTRSRSKSPKFFVSADFLMKHHGQGEQETTKRAPRKRATSKDSKGVHISTGFLKKTQPNPTEAPNTRALRSRQKANPPKEANEATTTTLKIPQLDGADDSVQPPKAGKKSNRPKLQKLQKSRSQDSDEDFEPSPPKKPKKAPVIKDRRVLSTDDEAAGGDKSKRKPTAADIWCEVWCDVEQQWMCVDLFKGTVNSEDSIRKSASSSTGFVYCYAFQNDLSVKDVTARYCPHWTTVHKQTVDRTWLETAICDYYGTFTERDRLENQQLRRMHEQKPLPHTISDFKDHPLYALKRHLLKFQAIYPPDAPTCGFIRGEEIYPRDCVYTLHSREIWLKQARTVKLGEQPYKIVKARPKWDRITQTVIKDMPLEIFGYWQTQDYEPPTAENGIVPRNAYGNVELFKECMLPKKTVHLRLPGLQRVCKKLGIDCANAVIGFDFHQGACHPLLDGFVVCEEFAETVTEAWHEDQANQDRKEQEKYEARVYGNWKKLIRGLLIRERLKKKYNF